MYDISVDNLAKLCEALDTEIIIRYKEGRE